MKKKFMLPDGSEMLPNTPYFVVATRDFNGTKDSGKIVVSKGTFIRAIRVENEEEGYSGERIDLCVVYPIADIGMFVGVFYQGAKVNVDFRMCELYELPSDLLVWKLNRMLECENYEMVQKINKEIKRRECTVPVNPQLN